MQQEISETLNIDGQVVNVHVEIEKLEPESIAAPITVEAEKPQEPNREVNKLTKFSTPATVKNPGPQPANGDLKDWIVQDQAFKQSQPLPISDGGKGVSH